METVSDSRTASVLPSWQYFARMMQQNSPLNQEKADLENTVAYSDSFFPFPDAPEVLINRGIKTIFSTSGSVNDDKIIEL